MGWLDDPVVKSGWQSDPVIDLGGAPPPQYGSAVPQINAQGQVIRQPDAIPSSRAPSRGVLDYIAGIPETAITAGTGILKSTIAPFAAVAGELTGGVNTPEGRARGAQWGKNVESALTYTPQTQTARDIINYAGEKLEGIDLNAIPFAQGSVVGALAPAAVRQLPSAIKNEAGYLKGVVGEIPAVKASREKTVATNVANSYENAARIEASDLAVNKYGLAIDPEVSNPTAGAKVRGAIVGERNVSNMMAEQNQPKITAALKEEVGIPPTKVLNEATFKEAHAAPEITQPYDKVKSISNVQLGATTLADLEAIKRGALIGEKSSDTLHIAQRLDNLKADVLTGGDGNRFLSSVQQLRKEAQDIYRKKDPLTPLERREAEAIMKAADILEGVLTDNLPVIKDRDAFLKARVAQAKLYQLEEATNLATGVPDPRVLAKMIDDKRPISGTARDIGIIAANFPDAVTPMGKGGLTFPRITRATLPGALGAMVGLPLGPAGSLVGAAIGTGVGEITKRVMAKNMLTPEFQIRNAVPPDYRPTPFPINNLSPVKPGQSNIVPFNPVNALVEPEIRPNWVYGQPNAYVEPSIPRGPAQLPAPSAEGTMATVAAENARRARMSRMAGAEAEAAAAANEAPRAPTRGGTVYEVDPVSGKLVPASQGIRGATPETFQNYMSTLKTAVDKVTSKQNFNLTAAEKIAWEKTKFDVAEIDPGFRALSDKAIAERMMDRKWVEGAVIKARDQARAFEELAARAKTNADIVAAQASREKMLDMAEMMEENLRRARPDTSRKQQGPKTRAEIRNNLITNSRNKLGQE
jgi:hypothetical protein